MGSPFFLPVLCAVCNALYLIRPRHCLLSRRPRRKSAVEVVMDTVGGMNGGLVYIARVGCRAGQISLVS
jgi:hypothetical protein